MAKRFGRGGKINIDASGFEKLREQMDREMEREIYMAFDVFTNRARPQQRRDFERLPLGWSYDLSVGDGVNTEISLAPRNTDKQYADEMKSIVGHCRATRNKQLQPIEGQFTVVGTGPWRFK